MKKVIVAVVVVVALGFLWYTLSPLFFDDVVNEELVFERETDTQDTSQELETNAITAEGEVSLEGDMIEGGMDNDDVGATPPSPGPRAVARGQFAGADALHQGSGEAYLIASPEGNILRFEDFNVTNGPDLYVVLSEEENPTESSKLGEHIEVARLKGNIGNQNYELDSSIDISKYKSAVIYCKAFSVVFATAPLN